MDKERKKKSERKKEKGCELRVRVSGATRKKKQNKNNERGHRQAQEEIEKVERDFDSKRGLEGAAASVP
jgi:lipid II:glycine glycyltransferase (peptidoglycan interpeptide bridge formation enzyme)